MGKLFRQIFKEDVKTVLPWMLSPAVLSLLAMFIHNTTGASFFAPLVFIIMTLMAAAPLVSIVTLASNDNDRFYGKKAAFYTSLPYTSREVTGARFLNFVLNGLIIGIFAILNMGFFAISDTGVLSIVEFIKYALGNIDPFLTEYLGKYFVIVTLFGLVFAQQIMAANTLGSSRPFNAIGKAARPLIFVVIFIGQIMTYTRLLGIFLDHNPANIEEYTRTLETGDIVTITNISWHSFFVAALVLIISALIYFAIINYFHKEKISVE